MLLLSILNWTYTQLSTRFWNLAAGIYSPSAMWALIRSYSDSEGPGIQLGFQFVFDTVEVRSLCRPVKLFHTKVRFYVYCFVQSRGIMLKLLPQSRHSIVNNITVCCSDFPLLELMYQAHEKWQRTKKCTQVSGQGFPHPCYITWLLWISTCQNPKV